MFYDTSTFVEGGEVVHIRITGLCQFELEGIEFEPEWPTGPEEWDYIITDFSVLDLHTIDCPPNINISPEHSLKKTVEALKEEMYDFIDIDIVGGDEEI